MKKYLLILFICYLNINEAKSQSYIPMLNDSLYWDVAYYDSNVIICSEFGNQGSGPYRYAIDGDTTINGTVYKKFVSYSFLHCSLSHLLIAPPLQLIQFQHQVGMFFLI